MASNPVAANLVMVLLIAGGFLFSRRVKQEVFPEFQVDMIQVSVPYPGASPAEVEQGIVLSIEDQVRGIDGVKRVTGSAFEGAGLVMVELLTGANTGKALQDVKNAVDRIRSFPQEAERPVVSLAEMRNQVISLIIYGDLPETVLREFGERVRDELVQLDGITLVELDAARPLEIGIEIPTENLRSLNLTLDQVAQTVRRTSLELPAGGVKTPGGEVLLRTQERRDFARDYGDIQVVANNRGTEVRLGDIARIRDGFEDTDQEAFFNGKRAIKVDVYRVGKETPIGVAEVVFKYLEELRPTLPAGLEIATWNDMSQVFRERIGLLLRNAALGLALVLLLLGLFLEPRLAFWVTLGIPISILGSFLFLSATPASINMVSLFAFIVTLGIVVDDAIVVGENVYEQREQGVPFLEAAVYGAKEIAGPVTFAVLTNIVAFMPLLFVPGVMGNVFVQIPAVVISVFFVSLIESLYILPAHLSHGPAFRWSKAFWRVLGIPQRWFNPMLHAFIDRIYRRVLDWAVRHRYVTVAIGVAMIVVSVGAVGGGIVQFSFMPRVDSDLVTAEARLPFGAPIEQSRAVQRRLLEAARAALAQHGGEGISRGIFTQIGSAMSGPFTPPGQTGGAGGSHLVTVSINLVPSDQREVSGLGVTRSWREQTGEIVGLEALTFTSEMGPGGGAAIDIELTHRSTEVLEAAGRDLAEELRGFAGVSDIEDGMSEGKPQLSFRLKPEGRSLGITVDDLARQVRSSFYGAEALRRQRGRNEVKVLVRLPEQERRSLRTVEELILRNGRGAEIPLFQAAWVERGRAYTEINRANGRRVVSVTADVDEKVANANEIISLLQEGALPRLMAKYPGLDYSLEGEQRSQRESMEALAVGFLLTLLAIYALLAIPFKSYVQPAIVMLSIPFGIVGALLGHLLLGYNLSLISIFGIVALSGVVVNDSLVMVVTANRFREDEGESPLAAICLAGRRRFRPILLTSLTTFLGLLPMIFETSMQARFLIPMAISLGFGVIFSTFIILLIVPSTYLIVEDLRHLAPVAGTAAGAADERLELSERTVAAG